MVTLKLQWNGFRPELITQCSGSGVINIYIPTLTYFPSLKIRGVKYVACVQENHNIFSKLSPEEYKQVLGNMKHCILATDLALFFPNKARLADVLDTDSFDWANPEHR